MSRFEFLRIPQTGELPLMESFNQFITFHFLCAHTLATFKVKVKN